MRLTAHFEPQAWIRDNAVAVDPKGPQDWDCTEEFKKASEDLHDRLIGDILEERSYIDVDDFFKEDPAAPEWVREWDGPFTISITCDCIPDRYYARQLSNNKFGVYDVLSAYVATTEDAVPEAAKEMAEKIAKLLNEELAREYIRSIP